MRAASEERLQQELERVKEEAEKHRETERAAARLEAERLREAAAQDARAGAEAALQAELARVRTESESRLAAEVNQLRAEADRQRVSELAELRAQLSQVRDHAAQHAQKAAADAIAAEVAKSNRERPAPSLPNPFAPRPEGSPWQPTPPSPVSDSRKFAVPNLHGGLSAPADSIVSPRTTHERTAPRPSREWAGFTPPAAPSRPAWARLGIPAVAAFVVIGAATASYNWLPVRVQWSNADTAAAPAPVDAKPAPPAPRTGAEVLLDSSPSGANIIVDGRNRGVAPLTLTDLTVGNHAVVFEAEGLSINRSIRVRADEPLSITQDMTAGFLSIFSRVPVNVRIDGRRAGSNEEGQIIVAPGMHHILLENTRFNFKSEFRIEVKPSEVTAHTVMLPMGALVVTTEPGTRSVGRGRARRRGATRGRSRCRSGPAKSWSSAPMSSRARASRSCTANSPRFPSTPRHPPRTGTPTMPPLTAPAPGQRLTGQP